MSSYCVFYYLPDPIIGERVNFGVFAYDDGVKNVKFKFLSNWDRLQNFAGKDKDISSLKEFAANFKPEIQEFEIYRWTNPSYPFTIECTMPRGSILDTDTLIADMAKRFLVE